MHPVKDAVKVRSLNPDACPNDLATFKSRIGRANHAVGVGENSVIAADDGWNNADVIAQCAVRDVDFQRVRRARCAQTDESTDRPVAGVSVASVHAKIAKMDALEIRKRKTGIGDIGVAIPLPADQRQVNERIGQTNIALEHCRNRNVGLDISVRISPDATAGRPDQPRRSDLVESRRNNHRSVVGDAKRSSHPTRGHCGIERRSEVSRDPGRVRIER